MNCKYQNGCTRECPEDNYECNFYESIETTKHEENQREIKDCLSLLTEEPLGIEIKEIL
jgi:hypothetical protein